MLIFHPAWRRRYNEAKTPEERYRVAQRYWLFYGGPKPRYRPDPVASKPDASATVTEEPESVACPACGEKFSSPMVLGRHTRAEHDASLAELRGD